MNDRVMEFIRFELKTGLAMLSETHRSFFKRMYSHDNPDADIDDVVDSMPVEKLDWALTQVQNSLRKKEV